MEYTPREIVAELDRFIIGQTEAKRAVAIALRNRYRRRLLTSELKEEVVPKNILMMGPTGVGKTEIARRLARLANAPFMKVEATKFTEVGYVGRDVESIIRDLLESAIRMVRAEKVDMVAGKAQEGAEERLVDLLVPGPRKGGTSNPLGSLFGFPQPPDNEDDPDWDEKLEKTKTRRERYRRLLAMGELDDRVVEIEVEDQAPQFLDVFSNAGVEQMGVNLQDMLGGLVPRKKRKRKVSVTDARNILAQEEANKMLDMDAVVSEAIERTEQSGIIFLDEIDKIAGSQGGSGPDVSREGVQRDILPIVEGSTVMTKYGPVKTDFMLFIAAGAFHVTKPSDLIPELQGRFPIRVELDSLRENDFRRILTEPNNALTKQYSALLATEGLNVRFMSEGIHEIARIAEHVNQVAENIGARRLHTILEKLLEDISFSADSLEGEVVIDADYVRSKLDMIVADKDLTQYIL